MSATSIGPYICENNGLDPNVGCMGYISVVVWDTDIMLYYTLSLTAHVGPNKPKIVMYM